MHKVRFSSRNLIVCLLLLSAICLLCLIPIVSLLVNISGTHEVFALETHGLSFGGEGLSIGSTRLSTSQSNQQFDSMVSSYLRGEYIDIYSSGSIETRVQVFYDKTLASFIKSDDYKVNAGFGAYFTN